MVDLIQPMGGETQQEKAQIFAKSSLCGGHGTYVISNYHTIVRGREGPSFSPGEINEELTDKVTHLRSYSEGVELWWV